MGKVHVDDITFDEAENLDIVGGTVYVNGKLVKRLSTASIEVRVEGDVNIGKLDVNFLEVGGNLTTSSNVDANSINVKGDMSCKDVDANSLSVKGNLVCDSVEANHVSK